MAVAKQTSCLLQWGSEYQTSLEFKWSKRGWMPNGPVFECHLNSKQPDHLNTRKIDNILFSYVLIRYLNGWSKTYDMVQKPTTWIPNHLKS